MHDSPNIWFSLSLTGNSNGQHRRKIGSVGNEGKTYKKLIFVIFFEKLCLWISILIFWFEKFIIFHLFHHKNNVIVTRSKSTCSEQVILYRLGFQSLTHENDQYVFDLWRLNSNILDVTSIVCLHYHIHLYECRKICSSLCLSVYMSIYISLLSI